MTGLVFVFPGGAVAQTSGTAQPLCMPFAEGFNPVLRNQSLPLFNSHPGEKNFFKIHNIAMSTTPASQGNPGAPGKGQGWSSPHSLLQTTQGGAHRPESALAGSSTALARPGGALEEAPCSAPREGPGLLLRLQATMTRHLFFIPQEGRPGRAWLGSTLALTCQK